MRLSIIRIIAPIIAITAWQSAHANTNANDNPQAVSSAPFFCQSPQDSIEQTICQHPPLWDLYEALEQDTQSAMELVSDRPGGSLEAIKSTHAEFEKMRPSDCPSADAACVQKLYEVRLRKIAEFTQAIQEKISQEQAAAAEAKKAIEEAKKKAEAQAVARAKAEEARQAEAKAQVEKEASIRLWSTIGGVFAWGLLGGAIFLAIKKKKASSPTKQINASSTIRNTSQGIDHTNLPKESIPTASSSTEAKPKKSNKKWWTTAIVVLLVGTYLKEEASSVSKEARVVSQTEQQAKPAASPAVVQNSAPQGEGADFVQTGYQMISLMQRIGTPGCQGYQTHMAQLLGFLERYVGQTDQFARLQRGKTEDSFREAFANAERQGCFGH